MGSPRQKKQLIRFGTKAETLDRLRTVLKTAKVLPQVRFPAKDFTDLLKRHKALDAWIKQVASRRIQEMFQANGR